MPRKKRIAIITTVVLIAIITILGVLAYLYLKTDAFKSNERLFAKYLSQNLEKIGELKPIDNTYVENLLADNKYTSEIEGKIEYTKDNDTSYEDTSSAVNKVSIKINGNTDKSNDYEYYNSTIVNENETLAGLEYLQQGEKTGVRLNGIQQFVSSQKEDEQNLVNINKIISDIDLKSILDFTDEEKQILLNTYIGIVQKNVSKDKYRKQSKALITINNKDVQTNAYSLSLTVEQFNDLYIKILQQLSQDEIILSRIDKVEEKIKEIDKNYDNEKSLREKVIDKINEKVEKIKDNNIGNDEVKVIVYENNMNIVRTSIEKTTEKFTIDYYDTSSIKLTETIVESTTQEKSIKFENKNTDTSTDILVKYENKEGNQLKNDISFSYVQNIDGQKINNSVEFGISNDKNKAVLKITDNINIVDKFENQITLDEDNVDMDELNEEQQNTINQILNENIQAQIQNVLSNISVDEYSEMLKNIGVLNKSEVQLPNEGDITEVEKRRFNSQFEFFASENLTTNNIKELLKTTENNFEDMKVLLKSGEIEDLDIDKINSTSSEASEYKKNISEILLFIKRNSNNEEKIEEVENYLDKNSNNKYSTSIEYDQDGLTRIIRVKIQ